jgi:hypothetical protein
VFTNNLVNGGVTNAKLAASSVDGRAMAFKLWQQPVDQSPGFRRRPAQPDLLRRRQRRRHDQHGTVERRRHLADAQGRSISNPFLAGLYTVAFQHDARNCAVAVTAGLRGSDATVIHSSSDPRTVTVGLS